jgi:hypothetical protein
MSPTSFLSWCLLLTRLVSAAYVYPNGSRLNQIRSMYAWEGFVYDIEPCKTTDEMAADFTHMKSRGARTVITFDFCGTGADASYYDGSSSMLVWFDAHVLTPAQTSSSLQRGPESSLFL